MGAGKYVPKVFAAVAPSAETLAQQAIHRLHLQTALPVAQPLPDWSLPLPDILLLAAGAAALLALLYYLMGLRRGGRAGEADLPSGAAEAAARHAQHLARAEQYAQQGAYVEAMHELLLEGLQALRDRAGSQLADSLTSREILRLGLLPEQARAALRAMIQRVEWTWFGQHDATLADYQACRDNFGALHQALRATAAA
jgi:hypothetical protein